MARWSNQHHHDEEDEEEEYDDEEEYDLFSSSNLKHIISIGGKAIFVGLALWLGLKVFESFRGRRFKNLHKAATATSPSSSSTTSTPASTTTSTSILKTLTKNITTLFNPPPLSQPLQIQHEVTLSTVPSSSSALNPAARMAAGMCHDNGTGAVFVYGGFGFESRGVGGGVGGDDGEVGFLGDLWWFDTADFSWRNIPIPIPIPADKDSAGEGPGQIVHSKMIVVDRTIVMFGGSTEFDDFNDCLFVCDTRVSPLVWVNVTNAKSLLSSSLSNDEEDEDKPRPKPRYGHSLTSHNQYVILFGGITNGNVYLNDLWFLNTTNIMPSTTNSSSETIVRNNWEYIKPQGKYWPKARDSHSISVLHDSLYLFCGVSNNTNTLLPANTLEVFNLQTRTWNVKHTIGEGPTGCNLVESHVLGDSSSVETDKIVLLTDLDNGIFNKLFILSILPEEDKTDTALQWSEVKVQWRGDWTMIPMCREYFSSTFDTSTGLLFVFGGKSSGDRGAVLGEMLCCDFKKVMGLDEDDDGDGDVGDGGQDGEYGEDQEEEEEEEVLIEKPSAKRFPSHAKKRVTFSGAREEGGEEDGDSEAMFKEYGKFKRQ